jgi:cytochrome oxidase assembly protein ShyY1
MVRGYSFRPRVWIVALAAAACAAGVALGNWQTRRAEQKLALAERIEASLKLPPIALGATPIRGQDLVQKHVTATGVFDAERSVLLDNRNRGGRPGYEVVTPLRLSPSLAVLVQRGWVERRTGKEEGIVAMHTPRGAQRIDGIALERLPRALAAAGGDSGSVRQNLDIAAYARELGIALQPIVIQQRNDNGDGLSRDWPRPDFGRDTNRAYALQWYSLAALAAVLGIVFSFRRVEQA